MVKQKILVTGGSGYIGARLCLYLAEQGYSVFPLCHSKTPIDQAWVSKMEKVLIGDVRDEQQMQEISEFGFDVIVHLVSLDHHQSNGSPSFVAQINVTPVWTLLDVFSKKGLKKFIYFSTAQVYGQLSDGIILENQKLQTQNPYALTHQLGEVICEHFNRTTTVQCSIVRLSNSYGAPIFDENNCWWLVVNDLCRMAFQEQKIVLQSDGSPLRDFIHGNDVCRGVQAIIETNEKHVCYNLCSGKTLSILEIAQKIKDVFFERYKIKLPIAAKEQKNDSQPQKYQIDNSLIQSIEYQSNWDFAAGINDLFDFLEKDNVN